MKIEYVFVNNMVEEKKKHKNNYVWSVVDEHVWTC